MKKKRYITLLEIMIVILLIGIITSVVGYNVKGSLDKGKVFKTEQAQNQIKELLLLEVAKGKKIENVVKYAKQHLKDSGIPKDVDSLLVIAGCSCFILLGTANCSCSGCFFINSSPSL